VKQYIFKGLSLGIAAIAAISAPQTQALPVFESNEVALYIHGYVIVEQINIEGSTFMQDGASRLGFNLNVPAYDTWDVGFDVEWGLRAVSPNKEVIVQGDQQAATGEQEDPLYVRQGHAFAKHDLWGDFVAGKQWSVYYDVAQITDWYNVGGGLASGAFALNSDGGISGTGRADGAFTWRQQFDALGGEMQVGVQYAAHVADLNIQVEDIDGPDTLTVCPPNDCEYGIGQGISLTYKLDHADGIWLGAAYNRVKLDINTTRGEVFDISNPADPILIRSDRRISASSNDFALIIGAAYGKGAYQQGLYAAVNWHRSHNNEIAPPGSTMGATNFFNAVGSESFISYTWGALDCYSIYGGYNYLESHNDDIFHEALITGSKLRLEKYFLGFNYQWNERIRLFVEGSYDASNNVAAQDDGYLAAGIRVDI
jgi:predicted porin